ncbi:unnamed protein product [Parnassius apollo]|uniref:(apollo) hypothetical protein n=1 Tax=Parnassius apollo TaxID=110799 RepID=A0A8S3W1G9_PARAO|nr:unnamed protein product [Parnassius apollo]
MPKCDNCDKQIAKKSAMCNKCSKTVHATHACTGLTPKQLATQQQEWTCEDCRRETPRQKSFVIQEEEDEDEEELVITQSTESGSRAMKKLLSDISFEVKKRVKKEIGSVNEALSSCCQKLDGIMDTLAIITGKIKELENKNKYLLNEPK